MTTTMITMTTMLLCVLSTIGVVSGYSFVGGRSFKTASFLGKQMALSGSITENLDGEGFTVIWTFHNWDNGNSNVLVGADTVRSMPTSIDMDALSTDSTSTVDPLVPTASSSSSAAAATEEAVLPFPSIEIPAIPEGARFETVSYLSSLTLNEEGIRHPKEAHNVPDAYKTLVYPTSTTMDAQNAVADIVASDSVPIATATTTSTTTSSTATGPMNFQPFPVSVETQDEQQHQQGDIDFSNGPVVYSSVADIFKDDTSPSFYGGNNNGYDNDYYYNNNNPAVAGSDGTSVILDEESEQELLSSIASFLSNEQKDRLARLAVAFSPPGRDLSLKDIAAVEVIQLDDHHMDIASLVCEEDECVSVSVPVDFPTDCGQSDAMEECLLSNISELDELAVDRMGQREQAAAANSVFDEGRSLLLQEENSPSIAGYTKSRAATQTLPEWWVPSMDLSESCQNLQELLNQQDFQQEVRSLAKYSLGQTGNSDANVLHSMVTGVCPAGLTLRAMIQPGSGADIHNDNSEQQTVDLELPFGFQATNFDTIRDTILAVVAGKATP